MKAAGILDHPFGAAYAARLAQRLEARPGRPSLPHAALLEGLREQARAVFGSSGLPGPKREEWRFTPLRALAKVPFVPASSDVPLPALPETVPALADAARIVLVNGVFRPDLSDKAFGGVNVGDLHALFTRAKTHGLAEGLTAERNVLGRLAIAADAPLVALNAAYMTDGLDIHVPAGVQAQKTLHVISIAAGDAEPAAFHPRVLIVLEEGASLTLVETHISIGGQTTFANPVTEISLGAHARLARYVAVSGNADAFHLATTAITLDTASRMEAFHLGFGGAITRQEISASFRAPGADLRLGGVYALDGASHHDFTTTVDHHADHCTSTQVFKGVVDGQSHGVYQGRVHVARAAQKTDARQLHKALFLSRGAEIDCKPELEIYADDVQCAHGAATGELDPDQLFYLAARGIGPRAARLLLVEGFLADALNEISDAVVRDHFAGEIRRWLAAHSFEAAP